VDDHAPYTGDLNLSAVRTHDELVKLLKRVRVRADNPSLRSLETTTRDFDRPLSKTVVAEMLKGDRFPHLAVMLSFLKACGVPANAIEPWQRAWERVAETRHQEAQLEEIQRPGTPGATDKTEITRLREQVDRLTADNEKLRLAQLAGEMDDSLSQVSPQSDPGTSHAAPQEHAVRYLELKNTESVQLFYDEMMKFIRKADEAVYIQGKGFHNEKTSSLFEPLIHAEREALLRGAEVIRIHPGNLVAASWAKGYAELADEFDRFLMYSDLDVIYTYDVILIDPHGHRPVVIYLYETRERKSLRPVVKPVSALFVMNAHALYYSSGSLSSRRRRRSGARTLGSEVATDRNNSCSALLAGLSTVTNRDSSTWRLTWPIILLPISMNSRNFGRNFRRKKFGILHPRIRILPGVFIWISARCAARYLTRGRWARQPYMGGSKIWMPWFPGLPIVMPSGIPGKERTSLSELHTSFLGAGRPG
jgi:hypothetical protein